MNLLEELRQLDPNEPGGWPGVVQAFALFILLVVIIVAGYFLDWSDQLVELQNAYTRRNT